VCGILVLTAGCVRIYGEDRERVNVYDGGGVLLADAAKDAVVQKKLVPMVKGSIYEAEEEVSVFGTCMTADGEFVVGATGLLSAWYPNGSKSFTNITMMEVDTGRFLYSAPMESVPGTYLTEFTCVLNESRAYAWGEWQYPSWVRRINQTQDVVQMVYNDTQYVREWTNESTVRQEELLQQVNATQVLINYTYLNVTYQLAYVASVANASVDRNDSYLAYLLQIVINQTADTRGNLTVELIGQSAPVIGRPWSIAVAAKNVRNVSLGYPEVSCFISTTNIPPAVNTTMVPVKGSSSSGVADEPYFVHSERIGTSGVHEYEVQCFYN
jgi:hypothetical protein